MSSQTNNPNDVELPKNVDATLAYFQQTFGVLIPIGKDLPPPPPQPKAKDSAAKLKADFKNLESRYQSLTGNLLRCTKECDSAPLDRKHWDKLKNAHDEAINKPLQEFQHKVKAITKLLKDTMTLPDADAFKPDLKLVYEGLDELEYDFQLDQYKLARERLEEELTAAEEACRKVVDGMRALKKEWSNLLTSAENDLPVESWNPGLKRNKFAALLSRSRVALDQLPDVRTAEAEQAAADLQAVMRHVHDSLATLLNKSQADYAAKAGKFAEQCQKIVIACDKDSFPLAQWNPLEGGRKWLALSDIAENLKNATKLIEDRKEIDRALGVFDDLYEILCEQVAATKNKKQIEAMLAGEIFRITATLQALDLEFDRLGNLTGAFRQKMDLILHGVNCESNAQRQTAWNSLDKECLPFAGFPWDNAKNSFVGSQSRLQQIRKSMPWTPENLKQAFEQLQTTAGKLSENEQKVNAAKAQFDQHNAEVNNFQTDVDLTRLAAMQQEAAYLESELTRIGMLASEFLMTAEQVEQMEGDGRRQTWESMNRDWMPEPGTPWVDTCELLEQLEQHFAEQQKAITWKTQTLEDIAAKIQSAKEVMRFKFNGDIREAMEAFKKYDPLIMGDEIVDDDVKNEGNDTPHSDLWDKVDDTQGNDTQGNDDDNEDVIIEDQLDDEQRLVLNNVIGQLNEVTKKIVSDVRVIDDELSQDQ